MSDDGKASAIHAGSMPLVEEAAPPPEPATGSRATGPARDADRSLNEFARTRLGTHLRAMYDAVVQQPVPDQFRDLIARLEAGEARAASEASPETAEAPDAGPGRRGA